jgi:hypothetical protein
MRERLENQFDRLVECAEDFLVVKSEDQPAMPLEPPISGSVPLRIVMGDAINFNYESGISTTEVGNPRTYWILPPESNAKLRPAQVLPKNEFCSGHFNSILTCEPDQSSGHARRSITSL